MGWSALGNGVLEELRLVVRHEIPSRSLRGGLSAPFRHDHLSVVQEAGAASACGHLVSGIRSTAIDLFPADCQ